MTGWKSARLHGGPMLHPLFVSLQNDLRFFQHPLPGILAAHLAMTPASTRRDDGAIFAGGEGRVRLRQMINGQQQTISLVSDEAELLADRLPNAISAAR